MTPKTETTVDQRLVRALGHPLRQRILHELNQGVASPSEIASKVEEPLPNVSYHVKILVECDAIELTNTKPVRGALEHFYRAKAIPRFFEDEWEKLPLSARRALFSQTLSQIWEHVLDASKNDGFDDTRAHIAWTQLDLDDQGFTELMNEIETVIDRALAIQVQSKQRLERLPADERDVVLTEFDVLHYRRDTTKSS